MTEDEIRALVVELKALGLLGIEAIHSSNTKNDEEKLRLLAKELDLAISGGSDFHGKNKPLIRMGSGKGNLRIPYEIWEQLKNKKTDSL